MFYLQMQIQDKETNSQRVLIDCISLQQIFSIDNLSQQDIRMN